MQWTLDSSEIRVLGSLIEKEITTPEYYPLTLNALVNACSQRSNRDPAVTFDDSTVEVALQRLEQRGLITVLTGGGNRVPKYGHRLHERLNLGRRHIALLCELMLRGPQTPGELRARAERMHRFNDLEEIEACLRSLSERQPDPLVALLPRQPGFKEARYAHLLSGPVAEASDSLSVVSRGVPAAPYDRVANLEAEVTDLKRRMTQLEEIAGQLRTLID